MADENDSDGWGFALLLLKRRRNAYAAGSMALQKLRTTKRPDGTAAPLAVAVMILAAAVGCNRCSRMLTVGSMIGLHGLKFDEEDAALFRQFHHRNERRYRARVEAAARRGTQAKVVSLLELAGRRISPG